MKSKMIAKVIIDIIMTILLPVLMLHTITGQEIHEWLGTVMLMLFIAHHILNRKWFVGLFQGKYNIVRAARLTVDVLALVDMIGLIGSGIMMSKYVFLFLHISGGMTFARKIHMLASYWGLILLGLHLGLHWNIVIERIRRMFDAKKSEKVRNFIFGLIGLAIAVCGISSFQQLGIENYLFLKTEYVFRKENQKFLSMYWQYFTIMGLFVYTAYYAVKIIHKIKDKK